MPGHSPIPDDYDDSDFDSPTPSDVIDYEGDVRPPSINLTPPPNYDKQEVYNKDEINLNDIVPGEKRYDDSGDKHGHSNFPSARSRRSPTVISNNRHTSVVQSRLNYDDKRYDSYHEERFTPYSDEDRLDDSVEVQRREGTHMVTRVDSRNDVKSTLGSNDNAARLSSRNIRRSDSRYSSENGGRYGSRNNSPIKNGNSSRLSSATYTANDDKYSDNKYADDKFSDDNYDDDFDNDDDFHSDLDEHHTTNKSSLVEPPSRTATVTTRSALSISRKDVVGIESLNGHTADKKRVSSGESIRQSHLGSTRSEAVKSSNMSVKRFKKVHSSHRRVMSNLNSYSRQSRLTSAPNVNVDHLRRDIRDISDEIEDLKVENKTLKRNNILLVHQLDKREKEELEVPNLYDRQAKELKALKDHLRRSKDRYDKAHEKLRKVERDLRQSEKVEKGLESLDEDEKLKERSRLRKQIERVLVLTAEADQRILQLEKYADNLNKCHESELAAEGEKHEQTLSVLQDLSAQAQLIKQNVQSKESELDKFRIQHTSRISMSRAFVNTSLSGVMCRTVEQPALRLNTSNIDQLSNQRRVNRTALKALPAPSYDSELSSNQNANGTLQISYALSPSPPTTARPPVKNTRYKVREQTQKTSGSVGKNNSVTPEQARRRSVNSSSATAQSSIGDNDMRKDKDEERRAELVRTNMVLSQRVKGQGEKTVETEPITDDVMMAQQRLDTNNTSGFLKNEDNEKLASSFPTDLSLSLREQTFAITGLGSSH